MIIYVNTYVGIDRIVKIVDRVARKCRRHEVFKEMMRELTQISEREIGLAKTIIAKYALQLDIYLYDGDKPDPNKPMLVQSIYANGKIMSRILGTELDPDKKYVLTPSGLYTQ